MGKFKMYDTQHYHIDSQPDCAKTMFRVLFHTESVAKEYQ